MTEMLILIFGFMVAYCAIALRIGNVLSPWPPDSVGQSHANDEKDDSAKRLTRGRVSTDRKATTPTKTNTPPTN